MSVSSQLGEQREIRLSQGVIRYRERGEGPTLLFVHGFLVNGDLWRKVVPLLSENFRCITPDWPLGSHELPMDEGADLTPPAIAGMIVEFADRLELDAPTLVANDSGGALSQMIVTRAPDRFGALVLTPCDAFDVFPPAPFNLLRHLPRIPGATLASIQLMRIKAGRKLGFGPLIKHGYDDAIVKGWVRPALTNAAIRRDIDKFVVDVHPKHTRAAAKLLPEFDKPTLIVWPPKNTFFKFENAERLAATIPNAKLVEVDDALTFLPEDQPQRLAEAIEEFARVPAPA